MDAQIKETGPTSMSEDSKNLVNRYFHSHTYPQRDPQSEKPTMKTVIGILCRTIQTRARQTQIGFPSSLAVKTLTIPIPAYIESV